MDGIILNNNPIWKNIYNGRFALHEHKVWCHDSPPNWSYFPDICEECFKVCVNSVDMSTPIVTGAYDGLKRLSIFSSLHMVSHRPPELTPELRDFMEKLNIDKFFKTMSWSFEPKRETCEKNGYKILIDDGPQNIISLSNTDIIPIILNYEYNIHINTALRAYTWDDIVKFCQDINRKII